MTEKGTTKIQIQKSQNARLKKLTAGRPDYSVVQLAGKLLNGCLAILEAEKVPENTSEFLRIIRADLRGESVLASIHLLKEDAPPQQLTMDMVRQAVREELAREPARYPAGNKKAQAG